MAETQSVRTTRIGAAGWSGLIDSGFSDKRRTGAITAANYPRSRCQVHDIAVIGIQTDDSSLPLAHHAIEAPRVPEVERRFRRFGSAFRGFWFSLSCVCA